uniref:protein-tyrosine-phosphatase n=1 Tax=Trichuris muris TaxID=70415 RepID=A0A5S6QDG4_TRIMR
MLCLCCSCLGLQIKRGRCEDDVSLFLDVWLQVSRRWRRQKSLRALLQRFVRRLRSSEIPVVSLCCIVQEVVVVCHFNQCKLGLNLGAMSLSTLRKEYEYYEKNRMWDAVLEKIGRDASYAGLTTIEAKKPQNAELNRYDHVLPYDQTRVVLPGGGYINANHVTLVGTDLDLILTQGPSQVTASDFWLMVWNERCENIVMLSSFVECSQIVCHMYFPMDMEVDEFSEMRFGAFSVKLVELVRRETFEVRKLTLCYRERNLKRQVTHYYLRCWPCFDVPASPDQFLHLLAELHQRQHDPPRYPTVVHCSTGAGRSGSFALIYGCIKLMMRKNGTKMNLPNVVAKLRRSRMGLVHKGKQLRFCWDVVVHVMSSAEWRSVFGIPEPPPLPTPSTSASNGGHVPSRYSNADSRGKENARLYSLATATLRNRRGENAIGGVAGSGSLSYRCDERYKGRVRRRQQEADRMRAQLLAMKEKMNREQDDKLFCYILFFLVMFALFVAFYVVLKKHQR